MTEKSASRKAKRDALSPPHCEITDCEWTYNFQRHRIVPGRDGGKYKKGNVISLCPNHHAMADDGEIQAGYLLAIVSKRIELSGTEPEDTDQGTDRPASSGSSAPEESLAGDGVSTPDAANGISAWVFV